MKVPTYLSTIPELKIANEVQWIYLPFCIAGTQLVPVLIFYCKECTLLDDCVWFEQTIPQIRKVLGDTKVELKLYRITNGTEYYVGQCPDCLAIYWSRAK